MAISKEFRWLQQHEKEIQERYAGQHIAVVDEEIAGYGPSAWEAYQKAKEKYPDREPLLSYILSPEYSWVL